jgi:hypothetical protein
MGPFKAQNDRMMANPEKKGVPHDATNIIASANPVSLTMNNIWAGFEN